MIHFNLYVVNFEKNHYIQDIDVYLSKCEKLYSDYNKIINRDFLEDKSNVTLKIVTDDVSKKLKGFNYLRMEDNDSGRVRYYFIDNMKYLNDGTIQIAATLDPVNSFQTYIKQTKNFKISRSYFMNRMCNKKKQTRSGKLSSVAEIKA